MRNICVIAGNVGKDIEVKTLESGVKVANFTIAESVGKDKTQWWNCTAFDKKAELIESFVKKGDQITISCFIQQRGWEKDGVKHTAFDAIVNDFQFPVKRSNADMPASDNKPAPEAPNAADQEGDLPF